MKRNVSLFGYYAWGKANSDSDGAGSFPANSYDLAYSGGGFQLALQWLAERRIPLPAGDRSRREISDAKGHEAGLVVGWVPDPDHHGWRHSAVRITAINTTPPDDCV